MKVVIAIDSFKGSISSIDAGNAVQRGVLSACPDAETRVFPVADGGEGTVDAIVAALAGEYIETETVDPLGRKICAVYGIVGDTAVIEMSAAAGLPLLTEEERDPMKTTTYGVGLMIRDALSRGCRRFIVGIGGSATNDGGIGMLQALGFGILDENGDPVPYGARGVEKVARITTDNADPALKNAVFSVACDVTNPLCGEAGCSAVFSPQKGARPDDIPLMDTWLSRYAAKVKAVFPDADETASGAGAAGGIGFAFRSFLSARTEKGVELVLGAIGFDIAVSGADLVITGEGRLDGQSVMGKAPIGVSHAAKAVGATVVALSGCVEPSASACHEHGIDAYFPILDRARPLSEAMDKEVTQANLARTAEEAMRLLLIAKRAKD